MEAETVALPKKNPQELLTLLYLLTKHCRIGLEKLEHFIGKLHSMHIAVPGEVAHLYPIQRALKK